MCIPLSFARTNMLILWWEVGTGGGVERGGPVWRRPPSSESQQHRPEAPFCPRPEVAPSWGCMRRGQGLGAGGAPEGKRLT